MYNFVIYIKDYDVFEFMIEFWVYEIMYEYERDLRIYIYSLEDIEFSKIYDIYFNVVMKEVCIIGFMVNYLRMYWVKKIMEWLGFMKDVY